MTRVPITDTAFDKWMQSVEDRLDAMQRGQQLRGTASFQRIKVGGVIIEVDGGALVATTPDGTSVTIASLNP